LYFAPYLHPPLTTVRQPKRMMGRTAAQLALDLLEGKKAEKIIRVKGELVVRSSTAPPGTHS
jgi:DNA-binding LacI/PurR family transcriptional regulator